MEITGTYTEAELADFLEHKVVQKLLIVQLGIDRYEVIMSLNWKPGNWRIITLRKKPREWSSLDRLTKHLIKKSVNGLPPIDLLLDARFSDGHSEDEGSGA